MRQYLNDQSNIVHCSYVAEDQTTNDDHDINDSNVFNVVAGSKRCSSSSVFIASGRVDCGMLEAVGQRGPQSDLKLIWIQKTH